MRDVVAALGVGLALGGPFRRAAATAHPGPADPGGCRWHRRHLPGVPARGPVHPPGARMSPRKPPPDAVPDPDHDYGGDAHQAAVEHLLECYDAWEAQGPDEEGHRLVSPASEPFDGCTDCEVREILYAAWPFLRLAALAGAR